MTNATHRFPRRVLGMAVMLVFGVALATDAQAATTTVYAGTTSADQYPLILKIQGTKIVAAITMFRAPCSSGRNYSFGHNATISKSPLAIRKGRFNGTILVPQTTADGKTAMVTLTLKGTIKGSKISGTLTGGVGIGSNPAGPDDACFLPAKKFTAVHQPGVVFGGATSQGLPVVLELARSRAYVQHFHVGWRASCSSGGGFQYADFLHGGSIIAGSFRGSFSTDEDSSDGGSYRSEYAVSGKFSKTLGSGKLKVTITEKDAAGAVQDTCSTPNVTFRVTS